MKVVLGALFVGLCAGCATHPVSKQKQQQVALATQTGQYAYLRSVGPPGAPR